MNVIAIADVIALVTYGCAIGLVIATPARARSMGAALKYLLLAGFGLLLFVAVSNVLEHAGITVALDAYEDYAEVLLVPLVAYILYSRSTAEQLAAAEDAARAVQREHSLLMSVVKTTPAGILMADDTGEVLFANDEARRIIELLPVGKTSGDQGPILDLATVVASAPLDGSVYPVETGGDPMWVSVRATPLAVEDSEIWRAVVVLEDVTDRVTTARELDRYRTDLERLVDVRTGELLVVNRELQEASEIRQRFLANMSHELRTPLNSIIGFTDLLLRELPGPVTYEQRKQLGMVKESSTQLLGLVDDILDLARIEAGHSTVVPVTIDLVAHVRGVVESMSPIAEGKDVHLSFESDGPVTLTTDPDKLGQIVRNLVSNALKFTDRDGSVTVSLRTLDGHFSLTVADTGIGIAPEDQQRIFEAFQQIDTPDRRKPHGTGLGLAICRELCDLLGYEISVESEPGVGSTFEITMPRDETAGPHAPGDGE